MYVYDARGIWLRTFVLEQFSDSVCLIDLDRGTSETMEWFSIPSASVQRSKQISASFTNYSFF